MTPIERAARAIHQLDVQHRVLPPYEADWGKMAQSSRDCYIAQARAALQAIREPSQSMAKAGDSWTNHHADCVHSIWTAMVDAALEEG